MTRGSPAARAASALRQHGGVVRLDRDGFPRWNLMPNYERGPLSVYIARPGRGGMRLLKTPHASSR